MGKFAQDLGINLRQSYNREPPRLATQVGCYAHSKKFKRMRAAVSGIHCNDNCEQTQTVVGFVHGQCVHSTLFTSILIKMPA